jgi:hypothetical protein
MVWLEQFRLFRKRRYVTSNSISVITVPPFDTGHRPEVFLLSSFISQPSIAPGLLYRAMTQQLLQTLQTHASIQELGGTGMPQTMQGITLMG